MATNQYFKEHYSYLKQDLESENILIIFSFFFLNLNRKPLAAKIRANSFSRPHFKILVFEVGLFIYVFA